MFLLVLSAAAFNGVKAKPSSVEYLLREIREDLDQLKAERAASDDDAANFGLGEGFECLSDPVAHTWTAASWASYAGDMAWSVEFKMTGLRYVIRAKDTTESYDWSEVAACGGTTCTTSSTDARALLVDPVDDWTDNLNEFTNWMNFGAASVNNDGKFDASLIDVYFCWTIPSFDLYFEPTLDLKGTVSAIVGFLAQGSWESAKWTACDENNHTFLSNAACTQRHDGALYQDVNEGVHACALDPTMAITATGTSTLKCEPGGELENCCWWGRGAIQTTGPTNYGALQHDIVSKSHPDVDLCANPGMVCKVDDLKFLAGLYFWVTEVQADDCFASTLAAYVGSDDAEKETTVDGSTCRSFARGIGGKVNMGDWAKTAHGEDCHEVNHDDAAVVCGTDTADGRLERFVAMMANAKKAIDEYSGSNAEATECTGNEIVDTIFHDMDLASTAELNGSGSVYTFTGLCTALKSFIASD